MKNKLPVVVIGGYLGAGKTTLVNHLLRHAAGRRIAVMVNDFGQIGIDADLIESQDGEVMTLAGGCICCAFGSDLIGALMALPERGQAPDLVLIETSGVALPGAVARSVRLVPGLEIDAVVVMVDAETIRGQAGDGHVGDTVRQQLAQADLLVLNKTDLVEAGERAPVSKWLASQAPQAPIIATEQALLEPDLLFGMPASRPINAAAQARPLFRRAQSRLGTTARAAETFDSASFHIPHPVDPEALARSLSDPMLGLIRAKGLLRGPEGQWRVLQMVGPRLRLSARPHPMPRLETGIEPQAAVAEDPEEGRLVVIGLRGRLDRLAVQARIIAAGIEPGQARTTTIPQSTDGARPS